ncbi:MAG: quinolinate synthase NadA [Phycisphaerales bacterium]|nr:quinolinate synthase NadA [Phycisphaerales bacterium]
MTTVLHSGVHAAVAPAPSHRVDPTLDLEAQIAKLKRALNAVILAHYYQEEDIQEIADFVGDSLGLSQQAAKTQADVIVFCGVHFMAETAKILNPRKHVLLPDLDAGCSLADRCPAEAFAAWLKQYPGHTVISYVNCSAAVKALSDIICTSSNAVDVVNSVPRDTPIVFAPDRHLGKWVMKQTGRDLALWPGFCVVHEQFSHRRIAKLKFEHPDALFIAHPECEEAVLGLADHIGSTSSLVSYVQKSPRSKFIVATEAGILHSMRKVRPDAELIPAVPSSGCNCALCPYMRLNTLEKVYLCMRDRAPAIDVPEGTRVRALRAVQRMLDISAGKTAPQAG